MKKWLRFSLVLLTLCGGMVAHAQTYSRVKVDLKQTSLHQLADLGIALDHVTLKKDVFLIAEMSPWEKNQLIQNNIPHEILIEDLTKYYVSQSDNIQPKNTTCEGSVNDIKVPDSFNGGSYAGFYRYNELLQELDEMRQLYPNLISAKQPIGTFQTIEGRDIFWVRISDNPDLDENEEEILYSAIHHAREPMSMAQLVFYMWYLLENYDSSEEIQHLLNNSELYFVPCLNPDGYLYNENTNPNGGGMHRKNRRNVGSSNKGVDLNRNYSYQWGTTGISFDPNSDVYCGANEFSEPETQAMKWFCEQHQFKLAFNAHSYSDLILFPIGATDNEFAEDHDYFMNFTAHMVETNGYVNQKGSDLYPTSGSSDDYMYKVDLTVKPEILAMTPEVGPAAEGFWPPISSIIPNAKNMLHPNLVLAHLAHRYVLVEDLDPERVDPAMTDFTHKITRLGLKDGPVYLQIEPLTNIASISSSITYDLLLEEEQIGSFAFTLDAGIQEGDPIEYILKTIYPTWTHRDTIRKVYGDYPVVAQDDVEGTLLFTGDWSTQGHTTYSPSTAYSDSENGGSPINYPNNASLVMEFNQEIDLTNATDALVAFRAKWNIENDYDYCQFQVSTDNGQSWIGQCSKYTNLGVDAFGSVQPLNEPIYDGIQSSWVRDEISLTDYLNQKIRVRFILESDNGVRADGFYFDDFQVIHNGSNSIEEIERGVLTLHPNPAIDALTVSYVQIPGVSEIQIFDMQGRKVKQVPLVGGQSSTTLSLDGMNEGLYLIKLVQRSGKFRLERFVKVGE